MLTRDYLMFVPSQKGIILLHGILLTLLCFMLSTFTVYSSEPLLTMTLILGDVSSIVMTRGSILTRVAVTRVDLNCKQQNYNFSIGK